MATGFKIQETDIDDLFEPSATGITSTTLSNFTPSRAYTTRYNGESINNGYYKYNDSSFNLQDYWDINGLIEGKVTTKHLSDISYIGSFAFVGCASLINVDAPQVEKIYNNAFLSCTNLSYVSFPACSYIGSAAFRNCSYLRSVSFPALTQTVIPDNCFLGCLRLSDFKFPTITEIGEGAFFGCSYGPTTIDSESFPNCTYINIGAFSGCTDLQGIYFPKCRTIAYGAFSNCTDLETANLPSCEYVYNYAFCYCLNLFSISVPVLREIGYKAFADCSYLRGISLPCVTTIYDMAFKYCDRLSQIWIGTSNCTLADTTAFYSTPIDEHEGHIYVPYNYVNQYKAANIWSYYSDIITGY